MLKMIGFIVMGLMINPIAKADIYRYVDSKGNYHYTDDPKHKKYKLLIKSRIRKKGYYSQFQGYQSSKKKPYQGFSKNKKKYTPIIASAAIKYQLDPKLLHAVIREESGYNPVAISSAGAVGLMQLMPATAKRFGVKNRRDPHQNVNAGAKYLKHLLGLFNSNLKLAVAAYNAGENAVKKYNNTIPPYPETQRYVKKVMRTYQQLKG